MPEKISFGKMQLEVALGRASMQGTPSPEVPFRILVLGDFSARAHRGLTEPVAGRRPSRVDLDNLDRILANLGLRLSLPMPANGVGCVDLQLQRLEEFHPDHLFGHLGLFSELRALRGRLLNPTTFAGAAAEVRALSPSAAPVKEILTAAAPAAASSESQQDTLARLMGRAPSATPAGATTSAKTVDVQALIRQIVAPHVVPSQDPQQGQLVGAVDESIADGMKAILHHPDFQAAEAAWRGLDYLIHNIELDDSLQLYLLDVSKAELLADLKATDNLRSTGLYRMQVEATVESPGADPWALVAGIQTFGPVREDAEFLGRLAQITRAAGAPFLGAASSPLADAMVSGTAASAEDAAAWSELRRLPESDVIGLSLPRFLLRLPYGKATDPVHGFEFEEMPEKPEAARYLWGNPAWITTSLLAQAFTQSGWGLSPGELSEVGGLPVHVYKHQGESKMTPCAETWLTDSQTEAMVDAGLMPLVSVMSRDVVRVPRFQSIHDPLAALRGRWEP